MCDYFLSCYVFIPYGVCRTADLKLFDGLFVSCYSLNDAGRIIVLGRRVCSAL